MSRVLLRRVDSYHPATKRITTYNTAASTAFFNDESGDGYSPFAKFKLKIWTTNKVPFGHIFKTHEESPSGSRITELLVEEHGAQVVNRVWYFQNMST
jgi:hypothetical protein